METGFDKEQLKQKIDQVNSAIEKEHESLVDFQEKLEKVDEINIAMKQVFSENGNICIQVGEISVNVVAKVLSLNDPPLMTLSVSEEDCQKKQVVQFLQAMEKKLESGIELIEEVKEKCKQSIGAYDDGFHQKIYWDMHDIKSFFSNR